MNLQEFIDYKPHCPICEYPLATVFHSKKNQIHRYEHDRLVILFQMKPLNRKHIAYKAGYSFGLQDNSWYIEFYNQDNVRFEKDSPFNLRNAFRELDNNLKDYIFYRHCANCRCYNYSSNSFKLNYKTSQIDDLSVKTEYVGMYHQLNNYEYKIYRLLNDYNSNKSTIVFGKSHSEDLASSEWLIPPSRKEFEFIQTPIIKFSAKEEVLERLKKLILFS